MKDDYLDTFITVAADLKLNNWLCTSGKSLVVSARQLFVLYLAKFLDLEARGAQNTVGNNEWRYPVITPGKKTISRPSYTISVDNACVACKKAKHPLCMCNISSTNVRA